MKLDDFYGPIRVERPTAHLPMLDRESLRDLGKNGNARISIGFDKHATVNGATEAE